MDKLEKEWEKGDDPYDLIPEHKFDEERMEKKHGKGIDFDAFDPRYRSMLLCLCMHVYKYVHICLCMNFYILHMFVFAFLYIYIHVYECSHTLKEDIYLLSMNR